MAKAIWFKIWKFIWYFLLMVGAIAALVAALSAWQYFIASDKSILSSYHETIILEDVLKGDEVKILASPRVNVSMSIQVAKSIQAHWRSGDLQFTVRDPTSSHQLVQIDLSRGDNWGQVLPSRELSEIVTITFILDLPDEITPGAELQGLLAGRIEYPVSEPAGFRTQMKTLNLPVEVVVLTEAELVKKERSDSLEMIKILGPIAAGLILVPVLVLYLTNRRSKIRRI